MASSNPQSNEQPQATRKQLDDIYEYARLRGLRYVFNMLPRKDSYTIDHVPPEFTIRNGRRAFLPKRVQVGKNDKLKVWAYLRLQGGTLTGGTAVHLYAETAIDLFEIKSVDAHKYPFIEPLNLFSASGTSYTSDRQLKYLIRYIFLELELAEEAIVVVSVKSHEMIAGALRKIRDFYNTLATKDNQPSTINNELDARESADPLVKTTGAELRDDAALRSHRPNARSLEKVVEEYQNPLAEAFDAPLHAPLHFTPDVPLPDSTSPFRHTSRKAELESTIISRPSVKREDSVEPVSDTLISAAGFDRGASGKRRAELDDDIDIIMQQIQNEEYEDEKREEGAKRQLRDAQDKLKELEARKKRRQDDLEYLLTHRHQDCKDWSKKARHGAPNVN